MARYSSERGGRAHPRCSRGTHVHACARARAHLAHTRVYIRIRGTPAPGSLLPAVCGSAVSHTRCYSCVTNACIRPPRTSARRRAARRGYTCTHRDGKCSQCTNLRRSPLERGRPALGTRRSARTYVCIYVRPLAAGTRARAVGRKATQARLSRASFFWVLHYLVRFAVFSQCVGAKFHVRTVSCFPAFGQF